MNLDKNSLSYPLLADNIIKWIKKQVKSAGAAGIILGLSGGIDSAVGAVLCSSAVGENLLALIMPIDNDPQDLADAKAFAQKYKIKTKTIDLKPVYTAFVKLLPPANKKVLGNIKPRLRMITLYYYANKLNYLVAGTSNKSELLVGYFTKYGDGGVDILPLGGLLKTQVRELAQHLGIPKEIIEKPPRAGLWKGQTDEKEMGISYENLDEILSTQEDLSAPAKGRLAGKKTRLPQELIKEVRRRILTSAHKRELPKIFKI